MSQYCHDANRTLQGSYMHGLEHIPGLLGQEGFRRAYAAVGLAILIRLAERVPAGSQERRAFARAAVPLREIVFPKTDQSADSPSSRAMPD